jgi:hypothetical protein
MVNNARDLSACEMATGNKLHVKLDKTFFQKKLQFVHVI